MVGFVWVGLGLGVCLIPPPPTMPYTHVHLNSVHSFQDGACMQKVDMQKNIASQLFARAISDCMHIQSKNVCKFCFFLILYHVHLYNALKNLAAIC